MTIVNQTCHRTSTADLASLVLTPVVLETFDGLTPTPQQISTPGEELFGQGDGRYM